MKRLVAVAVIGSGLAACEDPSVPTAPRTQPTASSAAARVSPSARKVPPLSGVVAVNPAIQLSNGPPGPTAPQAPFGSLGVGPNVLVNHDGSNNPQNEPSIAVDRNNSGRLVASANDYRNFTARCGLYASTDGGRPGTA